MDENSSTATTQDAERERGKETVATEVPVEAPQQAVSEKVPETVLESVPTTEPILEPATETMQTSEGQDAEREQELERGQGAEPVTTTPIEATPVAPSSVVSGEAPAPTPVKTEVEVSTPLPTLESEIQRSSVDAIIHALSPAQLKAIVKKYLYARSIEGRASRDVHLLERKKLIIKLIGERTRITRKEVMKLVGISRTGAKRYLNLLEKEGKIVQHGKIGPNVYYTLSS